MSIFYYVDPSVAGVDPLPREDAANVGGPYQEGGTYRLPNGDAVTVRGPSPAQNLYTGVPDATPWPTPEEYYQQITLLHFQGLAGNINATVAEERAPEQIPIEELRALRMDELNSYRDLVRYSACDSSNGAGTDNWAIVTASQSRELIQSIDRPYSDRDGDIMDQVRASLSAAVDFDAFKADSANWKTRWPGAQTVNIAIRHKTNGNEKAYAISTAQYWGSVVQDIAVFDRQTDTAFLDAREDIETETDWTALSQIVIAGYPWPPFWP